MSIYEHLRCLNYQDLPSTNSQMFYSLMIKFLLLNSRKNKNKKIKIVVVVVVPFIFRQDRKILAELYMQTTRFGEYKQSEVQI